MIRRPASALVALVLLLGSCDSSSSPARSSLPGVAPTEGFTLSPTPTEGEVDGGSAWLAPLPIPGRTGRILPVARLEERGWFGDSDNFAEGGRSAEFRAFTSVAEEVASSVTSREVRWHNALVYDLAKGEQWPLLRERAVISRIWIKLEPLRVGQDGTPERRRAECLLFAVTTEDTNGDGLLDDRDALGLLQTDGDGSNPRPATPAGTKVASVSFDEDTRTILVMLQSDEDGDGEFDEDEWPRPYVLGIGSKGLAEALVAPESRAAIDGALDG